MKKNIYTIGILAAAAIAFFGCAKEVDTPKEIKTHTITVTVQAVDSKTAIVEGATAASYIWSSGDAEYFHIKENGVAATAVSMALSNNNATATFTATFPDSDATEFTYSAYFAKEVSNNGNLKIQTTQSPALDSFDPSADLLVASDIIETSRPSTLQFVLRRVISMNKMTLKELDPGETISSIEISADKPLGGFFVFAGEKDGEPVAEHYSAEGKKLTLNYGDSAVVPSNGEFPVYFCCGPQEGITIAVRVVTDSNVYIRNDFTSTVDFQVGVVKRFGVKLGSYGTPLSDGTVYTLVEEDSELYDGATYIIYGAGYVIGEQKTNNRAAVAVTENNGTITIDNTIDAYPLVIETVTGGFAIKDIKNNGYLYNHRNDKNYLLNKSEKGDYTTWSISINNGVASIINVDNTSRGIMGFNPNSGSPLFAAYGTIPTGGTENLALYIDPTTAVVLEDPNLSFTPAAVSVEWDNRGNFVAPTLTIPSGLTATYSSSNEDVATVDESTGSITFVGSNGSTTITATTPKTSTFKAGSASYTITVTGAPASPGESVENPLDAAAAIEMMEDLGQGVTSDEKYYVEGTIDAVPSYFGSGKLTFTFVDASANQIKAYNCLGLDGVNFSGKSDLAVGDYVVVYGNLLKYNATTYEITNGQLALLDHPLATPTITFTQPSLSGCSFTVKVDGEDIDSGDTVEEGKTVNLAVTVGSGYVFDGWTVNGASVADASATTTSFVVGQSNISISASFHEDITYNDFSWDLSTDQTVESTSSKLSWYYRGVTMIASKGNSSTPSDNYCPPSQQSTRFYSGETLTISPYTSCTIGYVEFTATSASYATVLGNSTWTNASAVVNGTLVTVTPTNGDSVFSAVISGACGFSDVTVYYTGTLATVANRIVTISQPSEAGCSIAVTVKGVVVGNGGSVEQGKVVTIEATAGANFSFDSWTVTGATVADASSSTTSFTVGASDISISASFTENAPGYTPYSTGFESSEGFTAGTNYQGTVTQGPSGKQWKIYYGTTSTSSVITDSQSLAMRLYTSNNYGYAEMQFDVPGAAGVSFKAKAATSNGASIKLTIKESKDGGTTWSTVSGWSAHALTSSAADYSFTVSGSPSQYRIRFEIDSSSTKPSKSNAQLTIDDVSITVN